MHKLIDNIRSPKGVGMIEVLIAIVIGAIGMLGAYTLLANVHGTTIGNSATVQAQQDARNIVERIAREMRESSPEMIWPDNMTYEESHYVCFCTPRDEARAFIVDAAGKPDWQRYIAYVFDPGTHEVRRYQLYMKYNPDTDYTVESEIVSKNVEKMSFTRYKDMVTISIRTFANRERRTGHAAQSYADFYTMIKLRN
jgi:prepilin-type N-terminal cleavage/methylation domain-containing protein